MKNLIMSYGLSLSIFLSLALHFSATDAFASGGGGTGGGGTHVCFKKDGKKQIIKDIDGNPIIDTVELYDLYEAREARRYSLIDSTGKSANELLNDAVKKIFKKSPAYAYIVKEYLKYYSDHKHVVTEKEWEIIKDAKIIFIDKGCQYQQIAQWRDDYESIFIDGDINDLFRKSQLNIAGLALHEAVYATERLSRNPVETSDFSRKLVGQIFSKALEPSIEWSQVFRNELRGVKLDDNNYSRTDSSIISNLKNQLYIRVTLLNKNVPIDVTIHNGYPNEKLPKAYWLLNGNSYTDFKKENNCNLNSNSYYCDVPIERKEITQISIYMKTMKEVLPTSPSEDPTARAYPEVQVELFENGIVLKSMQLKLNSITNPSPNKYYYSGDQQELLLPTYEESFEQEILNLKL